MLLLQPRPAHHLPELMPVPAWSTYRCDSECSDISDENILLVLGCRSVIAMQAARSLVSYACNLTSNSTRFL